jgi:3'-5' exoribonuclease
LGSFDRLEKELAPGARWSSFDRAIGGGAFFAEREAADVPGVEAVPAETPEAVVAEAPVEPPSPAAAEVGAQIALTDAPAREAA